MVKVVFHDHSGTVREAEAKPGMTMLDVAMANTIPGIDGDCGGACACATCHVYVAPEWLDKLAAKDDMEESMLDFAEEVQDNSRLCCQIRLTDALDGITVTTPESQ